MDNSSGRRFSRRGHEYADDLSAAVAAEPPPIPRLGITVIGEGVTSFDVPLFRKLRPYGTYFRRVKPENGLRLLLEAVGTRAKGHPVPLWSLVR